jgi:hypothetical protein
MHNFVIPHKSHVIINAKCAKIGTITTCKGNARNKLVFNGLVRTATFDSPFIACRATFYGNLLTTQNIYDYMYLTDNGS